ncbi:MAG: tRNA (adenosine(37)-N6)-dimethylallyltransferase MiaA [Planctomycetota bacterium]
MATAAPTPIVPVIAGPTAGGKTEIAIACARLGAERGAPGEIISADAFQIYRGMDIGTGKAPQAERDPSQGGVPHHLIDIVEPMERFTVADWLARAAEAIADIEVRGGWPIVAGGTHLYVKALLDGLFEGPPADEALRAELRALGLPALREELGRVDPASAARIDANDERRTIRALEVWRLTGRTISDCQRQWDSAEPSGPLHGRALLVVLDWSAESINRRINARVRAMLEAGLAGEVRRLDEAGRLGPQAREALGYKQLLGAAQSGFSLDSAAERIKIETRRFAKNQRTWLRRLVASPPGGASILRVDPENRDPGEIAQGIVKHCFTIE